ncbi:hypothetical protein D5086_026857 [Populus alba]|uniref:Uncharacterized protein n=1 Tax=Populus alba TaxID=43335 RepID=A0ACC4B306_POPAL
MEGDLDFKYTGRKTRRQESNVNASRCRVVAFANLVIIGGRALNLFAILDIADLNLAFHALYYNRLRYIFCDNMSWIFYIAGLVSS